MDQPTQPERTDDDGPISVDRWIHDDEMLVIKIRTKGEDQHMVVGMYNAWRLFGLLAVMLGITLPKKLMKAIKL